MTLAQIKTFIEQLKASEREELRAYLQQEEHLTRLRAGTMNVERLLEVAQKLQEGMSQAEWADLLHSFSEAEPDYLEALDDDGLPIL